MKYFPILLSLTSSFSFGQIITNQVNIGGSGYEYPALTPTKDGTGYYFFSSSNSDISGNKTENSRGWFDFWIGKMDNDFNIEWDKTIGGNEYDALSDFLISDDGIFIVGYSYSNISGEKTMDSFGSGDVWLLRLDNSGNIIWQQQYGGDQDESRATFIESSDTSIMILASSNSGISGNKTLASIGYRDLWLIEVHKANGSIIRQKVIGTENEEEIGLISKNPFNNHIYITTATAKGISGDKTEEGYGLNDAWIIELDENLDIVNQKVFGGTYDEGTVALFFKEDYIYAIGSSSSGISGNKTSPSYTSPSSTFLYTDVWLLKLNYDLSIIWDKTYGGTADEVPGLLFELPNGNIAFSATSNSIPSGNKTSTRFGIGTDDIWFLIIDSEGDILYQTTFGGTEDDMGSIFLGNNNEYILNAASESPISGNKTVPIWGGGDGWFGKIDLETILSTADITNSQFEMFPNPATHQIVVNGNFSASSYVVSDISGKIILRDKIENSSNLVVDVSQLISGMYLLQIGEHQLKFVKQ